MTLEPLQIALGFALALGVGGLVGLERERHAFAERKPSFGGARTFPLVALLGALAGLLASALGAVVLVTAFVAVAALLAVGYPRMRGEDGSLHFGLTSELAAMLVFAVGTLPFVELAGLAFPQRLLLAAALGTVVMALLALRGPIHAFAQELSPEDLLATVRFALVAVVALPLLPNENYGPYEAFNPFRIGVVIVLIAGISFVGYVAVRVLGPRGGIGATGIAGGLVSSTAVTLAFSGRARSHPALAPTCALAIALAATIMFPRVLVEIAAIRPGLVGHAAAPVGAMFAVGLVGCFVLWRRAGRDAIDDESQTFRNPFRLRQALRLGLAFAVIRFVAAAAWEHFGTRGLLVSAGASGLADVDAITISVARMHAGGLETGLAVAAVTVAAVMNTLVKVVLAVVLGGPRLGVPVAAVLLPAVAVGVLVATVGAV